MTQSSPAFPPFTFGWIAPDLHEYRPSKHTYSFYPYASLPPLSHTSFTGKLQWLPPLATDIAERMKPHRRHYPKRTMLANLLISAQQFHLTVPDSFLKIMSSRKRQNDIPSCTACFFDLPEKIIPCPYSEDGYIIRFLNDQQGCVTWYLYLKPTGEHCILTSHQWLDHPEIYDDRENEDEGPFDPHKIYICAPSFEEFIYRFWLENVCWFNLSRRKILTEEQYLYLSHYKESHMNS